VKAILMKTASKFPKATSVSIDPGTGVSYTSQYDIFTIGAGYLDIKAALSSAELPQGTADSPIAAFDKATGKVYLVGGASVVWGSTTAWGSSVVWGDSVVWGGSVVWGDSVVWGSSVVWGDGTLAASGIPYGAGAIWGNSVVWGSGGVPSDALSIALNGEN
jgi:serine protease AprX